MTRQRYWLGEEMPPTRKSRLYWMTLQTVFCQNAEGCEHNPVIRKSPHVVLVRLSPSHDSCLIRLVDRFLRRP